MGALLLAALIAGIVVDADRMPSPQQRAAPVPESVESAG
jgi:hypothetical protein